MALKIVKELDVLTISENDSTIMTAKENLIDESDDDYDLLNKNSDISFKKDFDEEGVALQGDLNLDFELLKRIPCPYTNIIVEFADVEIFMISIDSLIIELTAHSYHNWLLGGQTIVLAEQIDQFLNSLNDLNAKFFLIWFLDLKPLFAKDQFLSFLHSFTLAYLAKSKWADDIKCFKNPLDEEWNDFLHRLTPSFLLLSIENPSKNFVTEEIDFASRFLSIAIQLINTAIPVVYFNGFTINFSSVMAYRLSTIPILITNLEEKILNFWSETYENTQLVNFQCSKIYSCNSIAEFWAIVIKEEINENGTSSEFEEFCIAVLISTLCCEKLGVFRKYPYEDKKILEKGSSIKATNGRRRLFKRATKILEYVDSKKLNFSIADLWDGRMILGVFSKVSTKSEVLPFRLQTKFATLHEMIGLKEAVPIDTTDLLLDPLPLKNSEQNLLINNLALYTVNNELLDEFFPEIRKLFHLFKCTIEKNNQLDEKNLPFSKWRFTSVPEKIIKFLLDQPTEQGNIRKINRSRQTLSRWYQNFADCVDNGNSLLIDFSRTPRLSTIEEKESDNILTKDDLKNENLNKKNKNKKETQLSKKDMILKANRNTLNKKQIESDKTKIAFATQVKSHAINALEEVFRKLELQESKALCIFEKVMRQAEIFTENLPNFKNLEQKRYGALDLVEALKQCSVKFLNYLDNVQKEKIQTLWIMLGFVNSSAKKREKDFDLEINLIDYQLYYGGRLIEILSDPRKDDRVTGFDPDGWQRKMLDVVDQNQSALIVAPTSAGKTFVSYYCIEKVLRNSNKGVVVYISPAKALMNQVTGSVYARFRNKPMVSSKVLYGVFNMDYADNCLNCQVLMTIPQSFEMMLLSTDPVVQQVVSQIQYVILDEVHCINASNQGHVWEHIFLLIRCPFLALSATVSNVDVVQKWLQSVENMKVLKGETARKVQLITYDERWSELELAIVKMHEPNNKINYDEEYANFKQDKGIQNVMLESEELSENVSFVESSFQEEEEQNKQNNLNNLILPFHPYSVYKPEKIKMFGIPSDQRLTARQTIELYSIMSETDDNVKKKFEPCNFFGYKIGDENFKWLTRAELRNYEKELRELFLYWLKNEPEKITKILHLLDSPVKEEFDKRSAPFHMRHAALHNIVPVLDELKQNDRLPALCFNDDRVICEQLAIRLFTEMEKRESIYRSSKEFKMKFNNKLENKTKKLEKRIRDNKNLKKKKARKSKTRSHSDVESDDDPNEDFTETDRLDKLGDMNDLYDHFRSKRMKLEEKLREFKYYGRYSDEDIYDKTIENILNISRASTQRLIRLFERGIGFHHDGMTAKERSAVEILFRAGFLGIVFSTSTLALGMNMPCKTVIFGIDTPMLTPLQFRQMSGRAGRRGFDSSGTVIFIALPTSKIRRLLTSSLATLRGNVPYTTSFMLKIFGYVKGNTSSLLTTTKKVSEIEKSVIVKKKQAIESTDVTSYIIRKAAALSFLKSPFVLHTRHESNVGTLELLLKFLTFFNVQLLRKHDLLNNECEMTGFAFLASHLSNFEPGNLMFTVILQSGALHEFAKNYEDSEKSQLKDVLVNIAAHLFTNKYLSIYSCTNENKNKEPILMPLPDKIKNIINEYNRGVDELLLAYLQLASPIRQIQNSILRLSGKGENLSIYNMDVVPIIDHDLQLDSSFVPTFPLEVKDHRNRQIYRNSYAYDFYKRGNKESLVEHNKLQVSEIWYLIKAFSNVLWAISEALTTMAKATDPISLLYNEIASEYEYKFTRAFEMNKEQML